MVLLIGRIIYIEEQKFYAVELSDGWYSIFTVIFNNSKENTKNLFYSNNNALLLDLLLNKKIFPGLKIHIAGMEKSPYQNLANFFAFENLPTEKLLVNIYYNNLSRAFWNEKLGLKSNRYLLKNLNSLRPFGGFASMIDVFVLKKYPLLERRNNNKIAYFDGFKQNYDNMNHKKNIFFKICVLDSLVFESKNKFLQKNFVEVGFSNICTEFYDIIKEGDRLKLTNLKPADDRLLKKRFDFVNNEIVEGRIYLELTKFSKIIFYNDLKRNSLDRKDVNQFGKEICQKIRKSISNITTNDEIMNKFNKEKRENKKLNNELDCLIHIESIDIKKLIAGKDSNSNEIRIKVFFICLKFNKIQKKVHDQEFFAGKINEINMGKIVLFLNVTLDNIVIDRKNKNKVIFLLTNENTKILSNNLEKSEFYQSK